MNDDTIIPLDLLRKLRRLTQAVKDIQGGRIPAEDLARLVIKGRTPGKTITADDILNAMRDYNTQPKVDEGSGPLKGPGVPVREGGWDLDFFQVPDEGSGPRFLPLDKDPVYIETPPIHTAQVIPFPKRP